TGRWRWAPCGLGGLSLPLRPASSRCLLICWQLQQVAHALALGPEVAEVLGVGAGLERDPLHALEAEALEPAVLGRVVGEQAHGGAPEVDQDLGADPVLAPVDRQAQVEVGVDGVAALLLEVVGAQLVGQPDTAALMPAQVD